MSVKDVIFKKKKTYPRTTLFFLIKKEKVISHKRLRI